VPQRVQNPGDADLARREAREIQRSNLSIFRGGPVRVKELATALGLKVESRSGLVQRARLELLAGEPFGVSTIAVRETLGENVKRFAIAHEIGHAVLLRKYPQAARAWGTERREVFADIFATELLAPPEVRANEAPAFRALSDPRALLRFASRLGFSPLGLLTLATRERPWFEGLNKIWLRVKYVENAFTGREAKLRIVSAHYDRDHFFVPTNQSVESFAGTDSWLASLPPGSTAHRSSTIALKIKRDALTTPRFMPRDLPAELSAVKLQPNAVDLASYLIVLADVTSTK
jgi:IrrE N-terminal-like domain